MTKINLRYVDGFRDRHGRWRYYFRRGRGKRFPLPGLPLTVEFMRAYQSCLEKLEKNGPRDLVRGAPGTFNRLAIEYFQSSNCLGLAETTQRHYRYVIESVIDKENIGHRRVDEMSFEHVSRIVAKRASTPGAANAALQKIRLLVRYAIDLGWRNDDPTLRVRRFQLGTIHTWSDEEIETFEEAWSIGTLERTAFALLLYTGQRRVRCRSNGVG